MQSRSGFTKERIPWLMASARAVFGPVMVLGESAQWNGVALATLVLAGLFSDIFDGILARRWKCDTAEVRLFDSIADIVFYAGCAIALWTRHPGVVQKLAAPILTVVSLEALCIAVAFIKFGKLPSYHSYIAKCWGLALASALVAAFVTKHPAGWINAALALGTLSNIEGIAMSLIMPVWRQDVKTLAEAWRFRSTVRCGGKSKLIPKIAGAALVFIVIGTLPIHAQKLGEAIYEAGTSPIAANTTAKLITTEQGLRFEAPIPILIPYESIAKIEFRKDVREHLGFFPAMFAGMLVARVHIYRITLSYSGTDGKNAAVFQVTRDDWIKLSELLRARAPACKRTIDCKLPVGE